MKWNVLFRSEDNLLHNLEGKGTCDGFFFLICSVLSSVSQEYVGKLLCLGYFGRTGSKRMEQASMDYEAPLMPCGCILLCHFLST